MNESRSDANSGASDSEWKLLSGSFSDLIAGAMVGVGLEGDSVGGVDEDFGVGFEPFTAPDEG